MLICAGVAAGLGLTVTAKAPQAAAAHLEIAHAQPCPLGYSVNTHPRHDCRNALRPTRSALVDCGAKPSARTHTFDLVFRHLRPPLADRPARQDWRCGDLTCLGLVGTVRLLN
jgi:hypothetical protein